ncbi:DEKNAAC105546 [Brettanomyces naardenensis]|uniref:DEKNAAC105547 n=1 Tax=Brettanomyces naardenensis TaxID=13370 RepID=A0A448YU48_BRENA|nr:DEKNAAC105546 [Brettanomyces naardenensis]
MTDSPTFFDQMKRSFTDVPLEGDNRIPTAEFLEASESLVKLFDLLGSAAFQVVESDMNGNITKMKKRLGEDPEHSKTLQGMVLEEVKEGKKKTGTQALLWLSRGLQFTAAAMRETLEHPEKEMDVTFTDGYKRTLIKYHSMFVRPVFKLAMRACPYRKDFFAKLGADQEKVLSQLREWLDALEKIVKIIMDFYESGNYGKGL